MQTPLPLTRDLVLVGGGHAHALVLKQWGMKPLPGARLTVIDPEPATAYTGMLPGFVAGHYRRDALEIDLVRLARHAGARLVLGRATGLDPVSNTISIEGRAPIAFDIASLDIGATGRIPEIKGFADHVVSAKPLTGFANAWTGYVAAVKTGKAAARVAIIGAGAAGVELALAAQHRLETINAAPVITLFEARDEIAPDLAPAARTALARKLSRAGVTVITRAKIEQISSTGISLTNTAPVQADFIIGATGVMAWPWIKSTGLETKDGYIAVDAQLRSISHPHIFAAGDCAHLTTAPRAKAGVYAVRAAPTLSKNQRAVLQGQSAKSRFKPQRDYLKLISTGAKSAVADKHGFALGGPGLWRLKDAIDQQFMASFTELKAMPPPVIRGAVAEGVAHAIGSRQPLCGGCGSKTGREALNAGLAGMAPPQRGDVLNGPGDDAAVLRAGDGVQVVTTDHLRAFTSDPGLFARVAAVHCLGDVWASGARPQAGLTTIILPAMSEALQARTIAEIITAATKIFTQAGADIIGGHTTTGAEMSLGFTVTGLAEQAVLQTGAQPGDVLVLTKPIGTGVILAGEMALKACADDVAQCWDSMAHSQDQAAAVLTPAAHAMTDVTGFGLAGHLRAMLGAELAATLHLNHIPVLPGALELAANGVRSSLFKANQPGSDVLNAPHGPPRDLLIDPQTAGGLLAAIPAERWSDVEAKFAAKGEPVWRIGEVMARAADAATITAR